MGSFQTITNHGRSGEVSSEGVVSSSLSGAIVGCIGRCCHLTACSETRDMPLTRRSENAVDSLTERSESSDISRLLRVSEVTRGWKAESVVLEEEGQQFEPTTGWEVVQGMYPGI